MYRGFSTVDRYRKFRVTDFDAVKTDLINHFHIRRGEKLMNPDFGTLIWNTLFEPLTAEARQLIIDDVRRIVSYDPRLVVENVVIDEFEQGIQIQIDLRYVVTNQSEKMLLMFNRNDNNLSLGS